jgi:hypothetical protein
MAKTSTATEGAGRSPAVGGARRLFFAWAATFLAFPPSGLIAHALLGPVDGLGPALGGGLIAGLGIGAAQWLVLRRRLPGAALWIPATGLGLAVGLAAGSSLVGYDTELTDLVLQGALSGLGVGALQALVLRREVGGALVWVLASAPLWALGWTVTTLAGIDVERQYMVFGATGALAYSLCTGALLAHLLGARGPTTRERA